ncbi:MAG: indole-3-glycerol-phosphate synthase [Thermoproteota archaeon]|nr:indole-3-glycerol-phosphate synthase [Candidatus Brockarchaeota archaeon]MBO3840608.1 indole-3-glycerol-phosphate synthase [Candidatus Brockarchaeota archaeon]
MSDFLGKIVKSVSDTVESGYYDVSPVEHRKLSLKKAILSCNKNPIIAEFKPASPSKGFLRKSEDAVQIALSAERVGVAGFSVLTEPKYFHGSLDIFKEIRKSVNIPLLMKDFIISNVQIEAASKIGADAILFIQALFDRGFSQADLEEMIYLAHSHGMEVLLEVHTEDEFLKAVDSEADMIGINNRNLSNLKVDINNTIAILSKYGNCGKVIVSESGIESPDQIRLLREYGVKAFLIGTSIMLSKNVEEKIRSFVEAD